ncbi:MAG: hypothetical protein FJ265_18245, partial [Planctomycetes bacterium]|nr:hypothetical protein [Planctomycetota bacterium]
MEVLSGLLHDQHAVGSVEKRAGRVEPFRREKLTLSIRHACLSAGRNDMLAAAEIVPEVLRRLGQHGRQGTVRSRMIRDTVWEVLQELEADPLRAGDYAGIRKAWEDHVHHKPAREKPVKVREVREV